MLRYSLISFVCVLLYVVPSVVLCAHRGAPYYRGHFVIMSRYQNRIRRWDRDFYEELPHVHYKHVNGTAVFRNLVDVLSGLLYSRQDPAYWHYLGVEYHGEPLTALGDGGPNGWEHASWKCEDDFKQAVWDNVELSPIWCREMEYYRQGYELYYRVAKWCDSAVIFNYTADVKLCLDDIDKYTKPNEARWDNPLPTTYNHFWLVYSGMGGCRQCEDVPQSFLSVAQPWSRCYPRNGTDTQCTGGGVIGGIDGSTWPAITDEPTEEETIDDEDEDPEQPIGQTEPEDPWNYVPLVSAMGGVVVMGGIAAAWYYGLLQRRRNDREEQVMLDEQIEHHTRTQEREQIIDTGDDDWA